MADIDPFRTGPSQEAQPHISADELPLAVGVKKLVKFAAARSAILPGSVTTSKNNSKLAMDELKAVARQAMRIVFVD